MPLVSVIVPIYNAEKYLRRCVGSVLSQTLEDFEIILVDDGSMDGSAAICDEYAKQDSRVRVLHKSNGGVASARQAGIDMATGTYSIHVDSDDWVEPTMLEEMYGRAVAESADMVICDFIVVWPEKSVVSKQQLTPHPHHDECIECLLQNKIMGSLWSKLVRTTLYKEFNISFIEGLNYCEDYMVCVQLFLHDIKIEYLAQSFYYYDQIVNPQSITRYQTVATFRQRIAFAKALQGVLNGRFVKEYSHLVTSIAYDCLRNGIFANEEFQSIFEGYKRYFEMSDYKRKRKFALRMAASGYQWLARCIIKTKQIK